MDGTSKIDKGVNQIEGRIDTGDTAVETDVAPQKKFLKLRTAVRASSQRILTSYANLRGKGQDAPSDADNTEMDRLRKALVAAETTAASGLNSLSKNTPSPYVESSGDLEAENKAGQETLTITEQQYIHLGEPLYTKRFRHASFRLDEPSEPQEFNVYAEYVVKDIYDRDHRIAIIRNDVQDVSLDKQPNTFSAVHYTEGDVRTHYDPPELLAEGEHKSFYPGFYISNIGGEIFTVNSRTRKGTVGEITVPSQQGKEAILAQLVVSGNPIAKEFVRKLEAKDPGAMPTLQAEAINWSEKHAKEIIEAAAERFPLDVDFAVKLHKGGYDTDEGYVDSVKEQIKGSWMVFAEGLGIDPKDFPSKEVEIWAPLIADKTRGSYRNRMRNAMHKRRNVAIKFNSINSEGMQVQGLHRKHMLTSRVHLPMPESGVINFGVTAHELFHKYLWNKKAYTNKAYSSFGKVLDEGMATIADEIVVPRALSDEKALINDKPYLEEAFATFIAASQDSTNDDDKSQPGSLVKEAYNPANSVLHLYLLKERGGLDQIKAVTKHDIKERTKFMAAYNEVYGEPFQDLVVKAKDWFQTQYP